MRGIAEEPAWPWLVFGPLLLTGCLAYHTSTPLELAPAPPIADLHPSLVVGVRAPEIELDPPLLQGAATEAAASEDALRRSISLIESLRGTGLFHEADFEARLACEPDLVLQVGENPRLMLCNANAPLALLFLGVIPVVMTCDVGHYFTRVDRASARFEFPWHATHLLGWIAPVLDLFPGWTWNPPDASRLHDTFRAWWLAHESELLEGIEPRGVPRCPGA